jgi:nucleoside-diphosphate-sugar epimerase
MKHTILGAGGSVGNALAYELLANNEEVRLVSRSGFSIPGAEALKADITSYAQTIVSLQGSDVVYLCVGLPYDVRVWEKTWPLIMQNTIDACKSINAKLIFFDNVYMYGYVNGKMTENTPYNPCSKKGEIRMQITNMLENEIKQGNIQAIIARAADLYGPYATRTSGLYIMVFSNLLKGKKAQLAVSDNKPHSYTYTLDCAKALRLLANNKEAYNQIWHLPTTNPALNGKELVELTALEIGAKPKYMILQKWMIKLAGVFDRTIYEIYEMLYQNEHDYYFDSTKFNQYFNFTPTSYEDGVKETIGFIKKNA